MGTREKVLLFPVRRIERERADEARLDKRRREYERGRERAGTRQSAPTEPPPYHLQHSRPAHTVAAAPPPWFARVHMRDCARVHLSLARSQSSLRRYAVCINDAFSSRISNRIACKFFLSIRVCRVDQDRASFPRDFDRVKRIIDRIIVVNVREGNFGKLSFSKNRILYSFPTKSFPPSSSFLPLSPVRYSEQIFSKQDFFAYHRSIRDWCTRAFVVPVRERTSKFRHLVNSRNILHDRSEKL